MSRRVHTRLLGAGAVLAMVMLANGVWARPNTGSVIKPTQAGRVMALAAPWIDGAEVAPGFRFVGARIDHEMACYLVDGRRRLELCLLPAAGARPVLASARRQLPGGAQLALHMPPDPSEAETAVFTTLATHITQNAPKVGLAALWHRVVRRRPQLPWYTRVMQVTRDPALWLALLLVWLAVMSQAALRDLPLRGWPAWLALLGLSVWTRVTLPVEAPMTAWSWQRLTTIASQLQSSPFLQLHWFHGSHIYVDDVQAVGMRIVSMATPLALVGHARKLFGDARPALLAGLLLAASPHALRFAAADTQFTVSMFWSSVTFFWLYCAMAARSPVTRAAYLAGLVPLLIMSMTARPLNVAYGPLMVSALYLATDAGRRRWRATLALTIAAVWGWSVVNLISGQAGPIQSVLTWRSVLGAIKLLVLPDYNPILFWRLTPPAWALLIVIGGVSLVRGPWRALDRDVGRRRGAWLIAWLFGYIVLHGVVVVAEPMNNARYQLHSLPAMALLAGAGLWAWWRAWQPRPARLRLVVAAVGVLCLASPWLHVAAIQDVDFATMQERLFLTELRDKATVDGRIPAGCTVVEIRRPGNGKPISKMARVSRFADDERRARPLWQAVDVQRWSERDGAATANQQPNSALSATGASLTLAHGIANETRSELASLSQKGRAMLRDPPSCLVFYEGAACAQGPGSEKQHAACTELLRSGHWQLIAERHGVARLYDTAVMGHLRATGDPLDLRMWRRTHSE